MSLVRFSDPMVARRLVDEIARRASRCPGVKIMEVCGTHTMEIGRLGIRSVLPDSIDLISGPGCPVCVTPGEVIDAAAQLAVDKRVEVCSFGDMIRVPGNRTSLEEARSGGAHVHVLASPLKVLDLAQENPTREFVFVAVGFETTIPVVARAVEIAAQRNLDNVSFIVCHRLVPPALDALIADPALNVSAFLLPGHVCAIIGEEPFKTIVGQGVPAVITGFEPLDILGGIHAAMEMLQENSARVVNMYPRVVKPAGNPSAVALMNSVYEPCDAAWRGIGIIPSSGLKLREQFAQFDACRRFDIQIDKSSMPEGCSCGSVLRGRIHPDQCPLFATNCTPQTPVGPCMVSSEGSCAAWYRYGR